MSTSYFYLKDPITSIIVNKYESYETIIIEINGRRAGSIDVPTEKVFQICRMFSEEEHDGSLCPIRTHWGGKDVGCFVSENVRGLDPNLILMSEYGEPTTVKEIRNMAGQGKEVIEE